MLHLFLVLALSLAGSDPTGQEEQVLNTINHQFKHLGIEVTEIRSLDPDTGLIRRQAFGPDGIPVDVNALILEEQALKIAARGKISPELGERMNASAPTAALQAVFWLKSDGAPDFRGIIDQAVTADVHGEDARRMALDAADAFFTPGNQAFASLLVEKGFQVDYTGTDCPIVIATVPAREIRALAALDQVDQAYYCFPNWENENEYAQPTLRTPTVHRRGNEGGAGAVKVMVQDSGGNVVQNNPYLPQVIWLNSEPTDYHATGVAGNVCMQNHPSLHGGAPKLGVIYSAAGWGDVDCPKAWTEAMRQGISFGNCSWWNLTKGGITFLDRYFDFIIRNFKVLMFKSNGNQGNSSTPYSTSPGNGYNMLCTGCYNDGDTFKWDDDAMASYSSYWNPQEGHEKPEVASPGDGVNTTATSSPWIYYGFGGTSSASPLTMGVATLVANRAPSIITHPEAVKAVIMVSAWHNVEGDPVISDKDGAGGVHAGAADAVARDGQYETGNFTDASFPYDKAIHCYQGDGTRVICLWHSDPDSAYMTDVLKMDLDISVLDPNNNVVASSANDKNPFELVYFVPQMTGDYTVRLTKQKFQGTEEPYCIAWSSKQDMATAEVLISGTGQIGTTMDFTFHDQAGYNENYAALLSFNTLPYLIPLPEGYILPAAWDLVARLCVFGVFPGFMGTLDGNGEAATSLFIPLDPGLVGVELFATMVTLDYRNWPLATAEASSFTIN